MRRNLLYLRAASPDTAEIPTMLIADAPLKMLRNAAAALLATLAVVLGGCSSDSNSSSGSGDLGGVIVTPSETRYAYDVQVCLDTMAGTVGFRSLPATFTLSAGDSLNLITQRDVSQVRYSITYTFAGNPSEPAGSPPNMIGPLTAQIGSPATSLTLDLVTLGSAAEFFNLHTANGPLTYQAVVELEFINSENQVLFQRTVPTVILAHDEPEMCSP